MPHIIWRTLLRVICWDLWKERNACIVKDRARSDAELLSSIYKYLFKWVSIGADFLRILSGIQFGVKMCDLVLCFSFRFCPSFTSWMMFSLLFCFYTCFLFQ